MMASDDAGQARRDYRQSKRTRPSTPTFQRALAAETWEGRTPQPRLTRREQEVMALLCLRRTNAEMAAQLCISIRTIETHVNNIIQKLGVPNRRDAAALADSSTSTRASQSQPHD
jgi:DNA-binding CsgD family transcriptional regulator